MSLIRAYEHALGSLKVARTNLAHLQQEANHRMGPAEARLAGDPYAVYLAFLTRAEEAVARDLAAHRATIHHPCTLCGEEAAPGCDLCPICSASQQGRRRGWARLGLCHKCANTLPQDGSPCYCERPVSLRRSCVEVLQ